MRDKNVKPKTQYIVGIKFKNRTALRRFEEKIWPHIQDLAIDYRVEYLDDEEAEQTEKKPKK
jgi:hypothetical protein